MKNLYIHGSIGNRIDRSKKNRYSNFWIGGLLGALTFVALYGFYILNVTYDGWLLTGKDLQQHYIGWTAFRGADWTFPIGLHDGLTYPNQVSIIYTDSIPLFAIIFKVLSPILPATFQYFGLFGLMCFVLNGGAASIIISKFTDSKIICMLGSMFFILSASVLQRLFGIPAEATRHTALAAHFLILFSIIVWLYQDKFKKISHAAIIWSILSISCILIQTYFLFMVGGIMCGYLLECLIRDKDYKRLLVVLPAFIISAGTMTFILGGFSGNASAGAGGFGLFSSNLNTLFNPMGYSSILPDLSIAVWGQYEGFAYLGLGMLILVVIAVVIAVMTLVKIVKEKRFKKLFVKYKGSVISLTVVIFVFGMLAVSNKVGLGGRVLFEIPLPDKVMDLMAVFRSSGRFIWCIKYFIMIFSIAVILKKLKLKWSIPLLAVCLSLQIADLSGALVRINHTFNQQEEFRANRLKSEIWSNIPERFDKIMFFPVVSFKDEGYKDLYLEMGVVAKKNQMKMNYFYFSRELRDFIQSSNEELEQVFENGSFDNNTLYILDKETANRFKGTINMYNIDGIIVASLQELPYDGEELTYEVQVE